MATTFDTPLAEFPSFGLCYALLGRLATGPKNAAALANPLGVDGAPALAWLVKKGYVKRTGKLYSVTRKGRAVA